MEKESKWKEHLLKSGLPLEYEVKQILDKKGCISKMEYSYFRKNEENEIVEFSYDIDSSYIKNDYFIDLMIECKYRHESTKWLFLPEEYGGMDEVEYTSFLHVSDHFTTKNKFPFKSSFPLSLGPLCSKGIEITSDGQNPKSITQAISQLSYAMGEKIFDTMRHQVDPILQKHFGETIFGCIPVIITTAKLYRANPNISINQIKGASKIEDIASQVNLLVVKNSHGVELEKHTYNTIQRLIDLHGREQFEKKLNSFNPELDFVISTIAENYAPNTILIIHHSEQNVGLNSLFTYLDRVISPNQEITDLIEVNRRKSEEISKGFGKLFKSK